MKRLALVVLCLVAIGSLVGNSSYVEANEKLSVLTTTGMIADAAMNIGGELIDVTALMGPGVDPHLYQATAKDVERMRRADVILFNGLHLEAGLERVLKKMKKKTVPVAEVLESDSLLPWEGHANDPHVWMDVSLWMNVVKKISETLTELDPENATSYEQQAQVYLHKLEELHAYATAQVASIPENSRSLVTAHDAFNYFGKAYNMDVRALMGISTETKAGAKDVQDLATFIAEHKIKAVFVESSVPEKYVQAVQAAVQEKGFDVGIGGELFSDAMGEEGTFEGTYIGMITHNVDTIVNALR